MPSLTIRERERRRREYAGQWVASKVFKATKDGRCAACREDVPIHTNAVFRRWSRLALASWSTSAASTSSAA